MNIELRTARVTLGLTQASVATSGRISETQYQNIEYGKCEPGVVTAIRIAEMLKIETFDGFKKLFVQDKDALNND